MKKCVLLLIAAWQFSFVFAQHEFKALVKDGESGEALVGVNVILESTGAGASTGLDGVVTLPAVPEGVQTITFTYVGYPLYTRTFRFPQDDGPVHEILLQQDAEIMHEVIVESTRANKSIASIPTRIEVLTDEIDEAANMEPSRISHLLTHTTGVQVQTTSAGSNGAVIRIQGLNGRYSKMLKDGFPLYGGFSGSLDVTQIPPLDLRQIEFIKGPSSTLHGGGAIAGVLNLLSKTPAQDEILLHFNRSSIGSNDLNAFFARKFGKFGFTNLVSYQLHEAYDADDDGFADLPELSKFNFNPRLFYYPGNRTTLYLGATITREFRKGGDLRLIDEAIPDNNHFYSDRQNSSRYTTQFKLDHTLNRNQSITFKNSLNWFDRYLNIRQDTAGTSAIFAGRQTASFSELTYALAQGRHDLVIGANYITEAFDRHDLGEASFIPVSETHRTASLFLNHVWEAAGFIELESGLRADWNKNESNISEDDGNVFILPRVAALIKYSPTLSTRIGGGMGYRPLTVFNEEAEPFGYRNFLAVDYAATEAERSAGLNADISYKSILGEHALLSLNHMFFYNTINNPILLITGNDFFRFGNSDRDIESRGFETQVKLTAGKFTWFVGYTFTDVYFDGNEKELLVLNPRHSIKGDLLFVEENKWRIGVDYEFKSKQQLSDGRETDNLFTTGILVERTLGNFVFYLNAENITDTRQTRFGHLLSAPFNTPQFTEIWAPLDGRFINAGLKIRLE